MPNQKMTETEILTNIYNKNLIHQHVQIKDKKIPVVSFQELAHKLKQYACIVCYDPMTPNIINVRNQHNDKIIAQISSDHIGSYMLLDENINITAARYIQQFSRENDRQRKMPDMKGSMSD